MKPFLNLCAEELIQEYGQTLGKCCLVLPTGRSGQVLKGILQQLNFTNLPHIKHLEEFLLDSTNMKRTSPVLLLLELYEVFLSVDKNLKLDKFTSWGYILLKDFDLIDRNLVDAPALFKTLGDIKQMESWKLDQAHQTENIQKYFKLWDNLEHVYKKFRERLFSTHQSYMGMAYRHLAENAETILANNTYYKKYIFIGFNALSKAEEEIFKVLLKHKKTELIWDADEYYMKEPTQNKAGEFLRKYRRNWIQTNWRHTTSNLLESSKKIEIIKATNASMQGKIANQILHNWQFNTIDEAQNLHAPATAVVLPDQDLVLPVINSLDSNYEGLNITMGLALKNSALFNLIDALFEQHQTTIKDKAIENGYRFNFRSIQKICSHPLVKIYEKKIIGRTNDNTKKNKSLLLAVMNYINRNNIIFLSKNDLLSIHEEEGFQEYYGPEENEFFKLLQSELMPFFDIVFQKWSKTLDVISALEEIVALLKQEETYFESEYLREFSKILKDLKYFVKTRPKLIDIHTFKIFLYQAFRETKFDFDSEKNTPLQVTGINETRNLDFKQVIILSVNEDTLPRISKQNSFIPLDACRHFGIPTYKEQDEVVSYHFYRLLQRAEKIALVYVLPSDTYGGSEKSRFIHQIENDLVRINPKIELKEYTVKLKEQNSIQEIKLIVNKNEEILSKIKARLAKGISPSQLNAFINCSLQYYFSQVAKIGKSSDVEETMGLDKFGKIVHEILEEIFLDLSNANKIIDKEAINGVLSSVETRVEEKFKKGIYANYILTGTNFLTKQVTCDYINNFLNAQIAEIEANNAPFEIITLENRKGLDEITEGNFKPMISTTIETKIKDENISVKIAGIIDRVDKVGKRIRIIDYKTGKVEKSQLKVDSEKLDSLINDSSKDKVRQLWLYKYIIAKKVAKTGSFELGDYNIQKGEPIVAGIYSLRKFEEGFLELAHTGLSKADKSKPVFPIDIDEFIKSSEEYINTIIKNILDTEQPFKKTDDTTICQYCQYCNICGR